MVKTRLGLSDLHRLGLFADQYIPKGTVIWQFKEGYDVRLDQTIVNSLPEFAKKQILHYGYLNNDRFVLCSDDARYFNHSDSPNTGEVESDDGEGLTVAVVDIEKGEELTCDYDEFDADYGRKQTEENPFR